MTREEKNQIIDELVATLSQFPSFYITDIDTLNSEKTSKLRRMCYNQQVQLKVAKNSLIKKALERIEGDYSQIIPTLKGSSAIMACETASQPARLIKDFRRDSGKDATKPALKSAYIDGGVYVGDNQLDVQHIHGVYACFALQEYLDFGFHFAYKDGKINILSAEIVRG